MSGHVRPMSALDPVIEHGGACSGRGDRVEDPVVEECSGKLMRLVQAGIVDSDSSYRRRSDLVRDVV
ncbi:hypothetical protein ACET3Z_031306 [Daucus carota]